MTHIWRVALAAGLTALFSQTASADDVVVQKPEAASGEAGLWMQVDQLEDKLKISPLVSRDQGLNAYIRSLVCRLAGPNCASLRVYVIDDPQFNAGAYPNGMVLVHTGLLLRVQNEAQLAFVLGHEITHFVRRHSWDQFERIRNTGNFLAFLSLGVAAASVGFHVNLSSVIDTANTLAVGALFAYSRDQEREADRGGFQLAVANGYDPREGATLFKLVEDEEESDPDHRDVPLFFANHPTDKERIQTMTALADADAAVGSASLTANADALAAVVRPHRTEWLEQELNRGHLAQSIALISRLAAAEPASSELQFYLGEAFRRRNDADDLAKAAIAYRAAIADGNAPSRTWRSLGIVSLKSGDKAAARDAFQKYLALSPSADDRTMVESYLARAEATQ